MVISILKRHKDSNGNTIEYTVIVDGQIARVDLNTLKLSYGNNVDNAYLVNGEYKAKKGCHIETDVVSTGLSVQKVTKPQVKVKSEFINDYYGKDFIGVCRRLRNYANMGNIKVVTNKHSSNNGNNVHLFEIIELCGLSIKDFVVGYLSVIQPYCLDLFQPSNAKKANQKWFVELGYSTRMIIKLDERDKNNPVIVSFHESNIERKGSHTFQSGVKDFSDKPCALIIDTVNHIAGDYVISTSIQTGFIRYRLTANAIACNNDVALIDYNDINQHVNKILDTLFDKLASVYLVSNTVPEFSNKNDCVSFSGRGYAIINQLILILDLYSKYPDTNSIKVLTEMMRNIVSELDNKSRLTILSALEKRFGKTPRNRLAVSLYKELDS